MVSLAISTIDQNFTQAGLPEPGTACSLQSLTKLAKARQSWAKRRAKSVVFQTPPTYCPHQHRAHRRRDDVNIWNQHTDPAENELRSRKSHRRANPDHVPGDTFGTPQTQDESVNTIQETPNSQFRLLLSVTPCMSRIDSEKSVNCSPSPQNQSPSPPLSPTTSLTSTYNNCPELFSPTLLATPCMPRTSSLRSVNCSPTPTSSLAHAPNSSSEHDEASSRSPILPPHVAQLWTNGHHPLLSLNDPHVSGEDKIYTIIPALCNKWKLRCT